jgi:hypothetical protein
MWNFNASLGKGAQQQDEDAGVASTAVGGCKVTKKPRNSLKASVTDLKMLHGGHKILTKKFFFEQENKNI